MAAIIIVGIVSTGLYINNKATSKDIFLNEERLVQEFHTEITLLVDNAVINRLDVNSLIDQYLTLFVARGQEKNIDWKIAVQYKGTDFTRNSGAMVISSPIESRIYYRLVSEKDGEIFVEENI